MGFPASHSRTIPCQLCTCLRPSSIPLHSSKRCRYMLDRPGPCTIFQAEPATMSHGYQSTATSTYKIYFIEVRVAMSTNTEDTQRKSAGGRSSDGEGYGQDDCCDDDNAGLVVEAYTSGVMYHARRGLFLGRSRPFSPRQRGGG